MKKKGLSRFTRSAWAVPGFILLVCAVAFGAFLAQLGYFQDDWHHVYYAYHEGADGLKRFLLTDSRPLGYLLYAAYFKVLGFDPANWHWLLMALRTLVVFVFWLVAKKIWPQHKVFSGWVAIIFAVYPAYPLQALSVAYAIHWTMFLFFALSLWFMLRSAEKQDWRNRWTFGAIITQILHLLVIEYFVGVELLRPILLWLQRRDLAFRARIAYVFRKWLAYWPVLGLYVVYRAFFTQIFGYDRFSDNLAEQFLTSPVAWLANFSQYAIRDFVFVSITPWQGALDPFLLDLSRISTWLMLAFGIGFAVLSYLVFSNQEMEPDLDTKTLKSAVLAGALGLVVGLVPSWAIGFSVYARNPMWSGRLALPAMFGASLLWVGLISLWSRNDRYRNLALSGLLGLAVIIQFNTALDFRASSEKQRQFYWQLYWRAPAITPNTLIAADNEILPYMGYYPTAYAINTIYPKTTAPPVTDYWFNAGSEHINWDAFNAGTPAELNRYSSTFRATREQVIAITFEPSLQQCLWVLRPAYKDIRFLTFEAYRWMSISSTRHIQNIESPLPPESIFGSEPPRSWCYYYLKADLAATSGNWQAAIQRWQDAQAQKLRPANGVELLPFIESFARADDWKQAQTLSNTAYTLPPKMPSLLCSLWETLEREEAPTSDEQKYIRAAKQKIGCQTP